MALLDLTLIEVEWLVRGGATVEPFRMFLRYSS